MAISVGQITITDVHDGASTQVEYSSSTSASTPPSAGWGVRGKEHPMLMAHTQIGNHLSESQEMQVRRGTRGILEILVQKVHKALWETQGLLVLIPMEQRFK